MTNFEAASYYFPEMPINEFWDTCRAYYYRFDNDKEFREQEKNMWLAYEEWANRVSIERRIKDASTKTGDRNKRKYV